MKLELSGLFSAFLPLWKIKTTKLLFVVHIFIRALNKSLSIVQINAFLKNCSSFKRGFPEHSSIAV